MAAQELIDKWGRKRYPQFGPEATFRFEEEKRSGGYCETCWHEWNVTAVYARVPGKREELAGEFEDGVRSVLMSVLDEAS
jgi:hypothetical protein